MPVAAAFIRIFAALLLSIPLFFSSSYYFVATAADSTLLDAEFVARSFQESRLYDRIYGEVFLREEFDQWTTDLIGGIEVSDDEKAELLKEVMPPVYIQGETEKNVSELVEYLEGRNDELDLFVDLSTPLANAEPMALAYLDRRLENLSPEPVASPEELSQEITVFLATVSSGQIPSNVPSAQTLGPEQRVQAYRQAIDALEQRDAVPRSALVSLEEQEPQIVPRVEEGNLPSALSQAGLIVAQPHIEEAISRVLRENSNPGRLDLIERAAADSERNPAQIRRDASILRFLLQVGTGVIAQWTALGIAVVCLILTAAVFVPYWKHVILWPSIILVAFGLLLLLTSFSASVDSAYWSNVICNGRAQNSCGLSLDISRNIASGIAALFIDRALQIIIIGAAGVLVSLVVSRMVGRK